MSKTEMPSIRFKGFSAPWELRKLGDICEYHSSSLTAKDIDEDGNSDLYDANSLIGKTKKGHMETDYITIIKDGAGVGRTRLLPRKSMFLGTMGALTPRNSDLYFLYQLVTNADLGNTYTGSTIPHIYFKDYGKNRYCIPSYAEQHKIGSYFRNLDDLITLHQRKVEKLTNVKKSMLEKMFPRNGSCYPEIRFKGFSAPWELRKLSEFVEKAVDNRGKTPPLDENGTHPLIEVATLGGINPDYSKVDKYLNDDSFENHLRAHIKKGDLLFTTVGSIGLVSLMDSREEAAIAQNIVAFRAKENYIPEYLYALFSTEENQYKVTRIVMGAVQPSIKVSQLVDIEYMLTTNAKEQAKIAEYFANLDHLITLHQRELGKLQNLKKALLGKMFV